MPDWSPLDPELAATLGDARRALHWAAQLPAAAAAALLPARDDFRHTTLAWSFEAEALVTPPLGDGATLVGIRPRDLTVLLLDGADAATTAWPLPGLALSEARAALAAALAERGLPAAELPLLSHDLPEHPVRDGAPFPAPDPGELDQLARWLANAQSAMDAVAAARPEAAAPRCWPHHFDLATLLSLDEGGDEEARSIGVGMTPGDGSYAAPYFYVTPWPYPAADALPPLERGAWHTQGWTGAVLVGSDLPEHGQPEAVRAFLDGAIAACRAALQRPSD